MPTTSTYPGKDQPALHHISTVDAESLHRYQLDGYHPVILGGYLRKGRYKVLHKLGWGVFSTVWAARDQRLQEAYLQMEKPQNPAGKKEKPPQVLVLFGGGEVVVPLRIVGLAREPLYESSVDREFVQPVRGREGNRKASVSVPDAWAGLLSRV
ncbi:hypothetical protein ACJ73_07745 [Blastomyces percursus]|uniref:non-specific serine/threonine protein kinase n=1 Tax=Blastomyces percursus TaxID=1658174 RepID=A0A1J9QXJ8_9EURO|nr:hypothetical protein ACJ73_07745 [Blastomyces percursus]